MHAQRMNVLSVVALLLAGAAAIDISDELADGWKMALRPRVSTANLQTFTGALGGIQAEPITNSNDPSNPFSVDGSNFNNFQTAADRSCDNQHNACADLANSQQSGISVGQCDTQNTQCKSAVAAAQTTAFNALFTSNADFDIFCDI